jgi:hypothetical protein
MTLAHTYRMPATQDHFQFGWEMGRIARALATGYGFADPFNGHSGPTAWAPPLYPLLLAAVFRLFGVYTLASGWVVLTINSVFSAATVLPIYEIASRCFARAGPAGMSVAVWSAWLWALYPAAMQYSVRWPWDMALTALLFSWIIVLALRLRDIGTLQPAPNNQQPATSWLLFGLLWGLTALSNSSLLAFLPACGLWIVWPAILTRPRLAATLRNVALSAVCFLAVTAPWLARNWRTFHAFVPIRSNFGAELYEATLPVNGGFPWGTTLPLAEADPEFQRYKRVGEIAFVQQQRALAKAAIRAHPARFLRYALRRVYFFWIGVPNPGNRALVEAARTFNFAFLSLSGLFGLALALRRCVPGAWLFFWAFATLPLLYYFVTVQARFRHPLEPLICILSVYLFQSADSTRAWSWQKASVTSPSVSA